MTTTHTQAESLSEVLSAIMSTDDKELIRSTRIVGRWVWVEFKDRPSSETRDVLKAIGFRWNVKRAAWQHNCGFWTAASPADPRGKYGVVPIEEVVA